MNKKLVMGQHRDLGVSNTNLNAFSQVALFSCDQYRRLKNRTIQETLPVKT